MKICAAQTRPVKGDIKRNIEHHKKLIELAVANNAGIIIFPELSLTGYEPALAKALAIDRDDKRLDVLQEVSDTEKVIIGVGAPVKAGGGICISMIILQPNNTRQVYSKKYLHADEVPFFIPGKNETVTINTHPAIALAICYELTVPEHAADAFKTGATVYIASVAKSVSGAERAGKNLAGIAGNYSMTVLMPNCVGHCDNFESGGGTAVWNNKGRMLGQLNGSDEGILIIDTETEKIIEETI